jgi:hypothetical protein
MISWSWSISWSIFWFCNHCHHWSSWLIGLIISQLIILIWCNRFLLIVIFDWAIFIMIDLAWLSVPMYHCDRTLQLFDPQSWSRLTIIIVINLLIVHSNETLLQPNFSIVHVCKHRHIWTNWLLVPASIVAVEIVLVLQARSMSQLDRTILFYITYNERPDRALMISCWTLSSTLMQSNFLSSWAQLTWHCMLVWRKQWMEDKDDGETVMQGYYNGDLRFFEETV